MSVHNYRCAHMDCNSEAAAVFITAHPTAFYGVCDEHLKGFELGDERMATRSGECLVRALSFGSAPASGHVNATANPNSQTMRGRS